MACFFCKFFLTFMFCMTGPSPTQSNVCCNCYEEFDYNNDVQIDLRDFAVYQREYKG